MKKKSKLRTGIERAAMLAGATLATILWVSVAVTLEIPLALIVCLCRRLAWLYRAVKCIGRIYACLWKGDTNGADVEFYAFGIEEEQRARANSKVLPL